MATYQTSSRYELTEDGRYATRKDKKAVSYTVYVSSDGDTFDLLAARFLGGSERYWEIAEINPQVQWPTSIPTGTALRIPL